MVIQLLKKRRIRHTERTLSGTTGLSFRWRESAIHTTILLFVIRQHRVCGDRDIGEVSIPVSELLETNSNGLEHVADYQVQSVRGKSVGTFTFSHQFRDKVCPVGTMIEGSSHRPTTTHVNNQQGIPAYHQPPGYANYPAPQYGTGVGWYPAPAPPGYPYPPQHYHQMPQQQPQPQPQPKSTD